MSTPLWTPSESRVHKSQMYDFMKKNGFNDYASMHRWSVDPESNFWPALIDYFGIKYSGELNPVNTVSDFSAYGFFPKVKINYAENLLAAGAGVAVNFLHESGGTKKYSYSDLRHMVADWQLLLRDEFSVGDVLGAYMPNVCETLVAMLAAISQGGCFTSTSCDFGSAGVIERFSQSKPKVFVAAISYEYNGKFFDQREKILEILKSLPSVKRVIIVDFLGKNIDAAEFCKKIPNSILSSNIPKLSRAPQFIRVPFSAPLFIMYSSGTTGKPKCIVHSHGGTLLQHVKELGLHTDLKKDKSIMYFTTCGWMMWNWLMSSLYFGAEVILYEGAPAYPSFERFMNLIDQEKINIFGTSPKFLKALEDSGFKKDKKFKKLETILSTGSPLLPEQFDYVYQCIQNDVALYSICGGTDIIGCFMLGNPLHEINRGEISALGLGMAVDCFSESKESLIEKEGELVCTKPFPSRPICFLGDDDGKQIAKAYFEKIPGVWHHGDFITITKTGSVKVFGRSDATLNPGGVRIGTAEIYQQTEKLGEIVDSLCVGKNVGLDVEVLLFVKLREGIILEQELIDRIKKHIKQNTTPRHVPSAIYQVNDIPYTRSGKKMELAISRLINHKPIDNLEAISNPEALEAFRKYC